MDLGIKKAKTVIRLDDSPESPAFELDLTSTGLAAASEKLAAAHGSYSKALAALKSGAKDAAAMADIAACWREVIEAALGAEACDAIVAYVSDGRDIEEAELVYVLSPVVVYLMGEISQALTANRAKSFEKYLGEVRDAI